MDGWNVLARTALIGLVFVGAVGGTRVVNSALDGAESGASADTVGEEEQAEAAPVDPIVAWCQRENFGRRYDCACMGEHAPVVRAAWSEQSHERQQGRLVSLREALARREGQLEEQLADEETPEAVKEYRKMGIVRTKQNIEQLKTKPPPDPMTMPPPTLFTQLAETGVCRIGDTLEAQKYQSCMESFEHEIEDDGDREEYCQCVGRTVAEKWTSGEITLHSQADSLATQQAWKNCGS